MFPYIDTLPTVYARLEKCNKKPRKAPEKVTDEYFTPRPIHYVAVTRIFHTPSRSNILYSFSISFKGAEIVKERQRERASNTICPLWTQVIVSA